MLQETPKTIYLKDYQPPEFLIDSIDLLFFLEPGETRVQASLSVRRNPNSDLNSGCLRLDGEGLKLISLQLNGESVKQDHVRVDDVSLSVDGVPDQFVLDTEVTICPEKNTALEGLYKSGGIYCTQCEAEGFRKITYFLDRPDVMSRFSTTITAQKSRLPVMLSNGNPAGSEMLEDGYHRVRWEDPFPKPCYLFALVAGDLQSINDRFTTASGREVDLRIYVEPENIDKCEHAMRSLKLAMAWDEEKYGREYDLDIYMIVAVNDFNMGAMENKGLNVFNSKYVLARPDTATDADFQGIESVIAHEYFHNWTGNRITCRDWFQLSLKEGLTVFRDQEFSADHGARGVKRIEDVRMLRAHQFAEDSGPMAHPVRPDAYIEINNFYTVTVYEKGAEVVRMQYNLLGPNRYRQATDLYFERFDGQAVTTDDFVACMEQAGAIDLTQFKRWYSQAGTPELEVTGDYDAAAQRYSLTVSQHCPATPGQPEKAPFHIPIQLGLLDRKGREMTVEVEAGIERNEQGYLLHLREAQQRFNFRSVPEAPVPSLLRGFTAPVKLAYDYSDDELMFLMANDSDGFSRWDAAQTLMQKILLARVNNVNHPLPNGFIEAFSATLKDQQIDMALRAEVLSPPAESYLGDQVETVDVDAIHLAREGFKSEVLQALQPVLEETYHSLQEPSTYAITPEAIGRRALKNLCLAYLMQSDSNAAFALAAKQYQAKQNMNDVIASLSLISHSGHGERELLLQDFYQRWQNEPLVLDKWFSIQAISKRADTLSRVKQLKQHADFSITNPNRVRSLIGAFCSANVVRFHANDGAGYRFLTDSVLQLDPINPQVAARMLRIMARWNRYDEQRQQLMRAELERVLAATGLSNDVYEIAAKSLGEG